MFATRREIFDIEEHRVWERRVSATDEIGDGIFLLLARGTRPLSDRLESIAARLEKAPTHIEQQKTRLGGVPPAQAVERDGARRDRVRWRRSSTR